MRVRSLVAMVAVVLGLSLPTAAMASSISWDTPVAITDVNTTLGLPGSVLEAVSWGTTVPITVTDTFGSITFVRGGDVNGSIVGPITANTTGGGYIAPGSGLFSATTSNANFDTVLDSNGFAASGGFPAGPGSLVTISGLNAGRTYTVQVFGIDDRTSPLVITLRSGRYQDTAGGSGNNSATIVYGSNQYVLGTFIAGGATQDYYMQGVFDANVVFNAAVVRLTAVPEPSSLSLLSVAGIGMGLVARKRRRSR